jgi:flagellar export protein FliJ
MRRFHFPLAHVRDFRRRQLEVEEAKLQTLLAERQTLEAEAYRLVSETSDARNSLAVTTSSEARELVAADRYLRHLQAVQKRHAARVTDWQTRASKQRQMLVKARRRVRLLEKLEEKQLRQWQGEADREQENLSAELYLARWNQR